VMTFCPATSATDVLHDVVPDAVPLPPVVALVHLTLLTPTLSEAVPANASGVPLAVQVDAVVGLVIVIDGGVVSRAARAGIVNAVTINATAQSCSVLLCIV
jgi:hypothetical protein